MLTIQQQNLIQNLLSGEYGSNKQAAIAAGYAPRSAAQSVSRLVNNSEFKEVLGAEKQRLEQAQLDRSHDTEPLRLQKLAVDVALAEAKLQQMQPDDLLEDRQEARDSWAQTIAYAFELGASTFAESGSAGVQARLVGLTDEIETWVLLREECEADDEGTNTDA